MASELKNLSTFEGTDIPNAEKMKLLIKEKKRLKKIAERKMQHECSEQYELDIKSSIKESIRGKL